VNGWKVFATVAAISWLVSVAIGAAMFLHLLWPEVLSWGTACAVSGAAVLVLYLVERFRKPAKARLPAGPGELPKRGRLAAGIVGSVGIIALLFIIFSYISDRRSVGREAHIAGQPLPGQPLYRPFQDFIPAFVGPKTLYSLVKLPEAQRETRVQELESSGQILLVLKGERVQVVDREFLGPLYQIRLLDGPRNGARAWVSEEELVFTRE
jgi:hypothetical protein